MKKIIALDIGSSAIKACAYQLNNEIELLYSCVVNIGLYSPESGYVENDPEEVWNKVCDAIKTVFDKTCISKEDIGCLSICSQAQCVVLVDRDGNALTPIYNSQDGRAIDTFNRYYSNGIKINGINVIKLAKAYLATGFMPGSAKDPVFKYKWVEDNHPEIYKNAYKWLDIKDYIICRLTGEFTTTKDNAHAYTIYNSRENKGNWSNVVSGIFKVDMNKLPKVVESTDFVGKVSEAISKQTGLLVGTPVIGGIIDSSGVQYGSGAVDVGETMIYWGTSGWVSTVIDKMKIDPFNLVGALITAKDSLYHYYACLDSAGISYKWIKEHIIEDDGVINSKDLIIDDSYENMNKAINDVPIGSEGMMYAPWITGCRAPFEASDIGGMFINIKNYMNKKHFVRAVVEGVCYQYKLLMEAAMKKVGPIDRIKFVGGGAKSEAISQILADITGCVVEVPGNPQDVGTLGAAMIGFCALDNKIDFSKLVHNQKIEKTYIPNKENNRIYNEYYKVYKKLYKNNKKILSKLTEISEGGNGL